MPFSEDISYKEYRAAAKESQDTEELVRILQEIDEEWIDEWEKSQESKTKG